MKAKSTLRVSYATALHDDKETKRILGVLNEHRTIIGKETREFEDRTAKLFGNKFGVMVNSGSSANLLALEILNLPRGSEVITPLLTFSTTIAPLIQKGLIPVFADVEQGRYQINVDHVERLISKKTKALMIPLLLGNVPDLKRLQQIAKQSKLFFIIDSCDTFAATFDKKAVGDYSDIITTSFYGSHIITAGGGGGMLLFNRADWFDQARILRGWGRDSSIFGDSEEITKRFSTKVDGIQYDAKFIFSKIGYNFLPTEISAAFGNAQLDKIKKFKKTRKENFKRLYKFFSKYTSVFQLPIQDQRVQTSWLAFPLTIKSNAPFTRLELATYLENNNIQTRPIFTGNILRQPGFKNTPHKTLPQYNYQVTNSIMESGFVIACHHGLKEEHLKKIETTFDTFINKNLLS